MDEDDDSSLRAASPHRKESLWKRSKKILDANQITFLQPLLKNSEGGCFQSIVVIIYCSMRVCALVLCFYLRSVYFGPKTVLGSLVSMHYFILYTPCFVVHGEHSLSSLMLS